VAVNDYEAKMLCDRTGQTLESLSRSHLKGVIVTLGAEGCDVWQQGVRTHVAGVAATEVVDPTDAATPSAVHCCSGSSAIGRCNVVWSWATRSVR
jgi:adenosine kinase